MSRQTKFIFITGGVLSGLGKGITAASIGNVLKSRGLTVNLQKCDPYFNVDAGMLNPREHGECFVTRDGAETDLDLGHYERFTDVELTQSSSLMSGRVYRQVIEDERAGKYGGKSVQIIPHITGAIQKYIQEAGKGFDVHIVEIGGTVGDYESQAFVEAIREMAGKVGRENCLFVHLVYLPFLGASQEIKTKPAQSSVRELLGQGIHPDILVARSEVPANGQATQKLSLFSGVEKEAILLLPNAASIYQVPLTIQERGLDKLICEKLNLKAKPAQMKSWQQLVGKILAPAEQTVNVGVVAKYMDNTDTYMSVFEALKAAGWSHNADVEIHWIDAEKLEQMSPAEQKAELSKVDGLVVPGGFGSRGVEGKIAAARYAFKQKVPYLGLCLGLHVAMIAAARNAGLAGANTSEIDPDCQHPVISTMAGQQGKENTGGTMRLGNYRCELVSDSLAAKLYGTKQIVERHRHRYEANPDYQDQYEGWGIKASGINPDNHLVEVIEGIKHPFLLASQYHPEFKSRPNHPHPMFSGFVQACCQKTKTVLK